MAQPRPSSNAILLLLFSLILPTTFALSSLFAPRDNYLLNCGSPSQASALSDRRLFLPDAPFLRPHSPSLSLSGDPNSSSPPLYATARLFTAPASYSFPVSGGPLVLRLHFRPFLSAAFDLSRALFHVSASGFLLLADFRADAPLIKEFFITTPAAAHDFVLSFVPSDRSSFAFVSAIELFSAPPDLIPDTARLVLPYGTLNVDGFANHAMETVYRVNVGGPKITPFNDTLWRTWIPDASLLSPLSSSQDSKVVSFSSRIAYQKFGASREVAPDRVYSTGRVSESNSSITWAFDVNPGFKYLIRLHFCDIVSLALNELYFNVYVNGYLAYEDFDISAATEQVLASPYYVDFVADVNGSGLLNVSVGPSKISSTLKVDALLNGLEIMKLNDTIGSLTGVIPPSMVMQPTAGVGFRAFIRSVFCGLAFVSLCMIVFTLVMRLKAESRNHMAWTPLPRDVSEGSLGNGILLSQRKFLYF